VPDYFVFDLVKARLILLFKLGLGSGWAIIPTVFEQVIAASLS